MTRQDMIDKLLVWYVDWLRAYGYADFDPTRATEMEYSKWNSLNDMTDKQLKDLYVQELIRRESHAKDESER